MRIRSFRGLCPPPDVAATVAAVPYDVVSTEEARALAQGNEKSLLWISRAEIHFPAGHNPYADDVYAKAVETMRTFENRGWLRRESQPGLFAYRQTMGSHSQIGLVAVCHADDYESDIIKKHEKTRPDKENDRTRLTSELDADLEPVFLTFRDDQGIGAALESVVASQAPMFDFTAPDGIRHTVWRVSDAERMVASFTNIPVAYVADGHHRSASAARVARERRGANPRHSGTEGYNWFLAVLFPADQLQILPYNRVVHDLNGQSADAFRRAVEAVAPLRAGADPDPKRPGDIRMRLEGRWFGLEWAPEAGADPISKLDVSFLQDRILGPLLGIEDPRTSQRIEFVGGIRGTGALEQRADALGGVAFSLAPVTVDQLMEISDAGQIMPPKSTWFEPKLRSGLFVYPLRSSQSN